MTGQGVGLRAGPRQGVVVRVVADHAPFKVGALVTMTAADALKAVQSGWAKIPVNHAETATREARETR